MTRRFLPLLAVLLTPTLLGQGKNMGQAGQYYQQKPKFKLVPTQKRAQGGDIKWSAGKPNQPNKIEYIQGEYAILEPDVVIEYQDVKVHADKATVNLRTKDVTAEGHVIIDQGPTRLSGNRVVYNLDSKTGTFFDATGSMDPSIYFQGEKIEKLSEDTYRLTNGLFTSCDIDNPSWSFHVRQMDVTIDDYAHMKDFTFRAHRFPIFWAPRLVWPTKHDRARGFLMPRLLLTEFPGRGNPPQNSLGNRLEIGYFIPIGESMDTTLYADLNTRGYNGLGLNFRYRPNQNVKLGDMSAYAIHDPLSKTQQWRYNYKHSQDNLPGGFRGVVDIEDFSDLDFFRNYERDPRIHFQSQVYSSAYLTKNTSRYSLNFLSDRRDIVLGHDFSVPGAPVIKNRYMQLPTAQMRLYPNRIGNSPFYLSYETSASHLVTSGLTTAPNVDYVRGDLFPTVSMQIRTPPWFSVRPQVSGRGTYYSAQLEKDSTTVAVSDPLNRFYAQGQVEVVGPSFSRVFSESIGGFSKFKHVIEPRFRYVHTTNVNDQERVMRFDTVDTPIVPIVRDQVEYSLTHRLIGKEAGENGNAREVLSFALRQTVSLSNRFTNATGGTTLPPGQDSKFTPLVASLHVNPYQSITLDANATLGNLSHKIDQTSISGNLIGTGRNQDKYLSFTWFASFQHQLADNTMTTASNSSQIRINTGSSLLNERIRADVQLNFDAKQGTFLEQRYLIGGNAACYGLAFEYRRYLVYDPLPKPANSYGIAVSLKNVGTIATH
jgi:LPS-assembly protein